MRYQTVFRKSLLHPCLRSLYLVVGKQGDILKCALMEGWTRKGPWASSWKTRAKGTWVLTHGFLENRHMSVASHCSSGPMFQTSGAPT